MAKFKYSAISKSGKKINGIVEAYDELSAVAKIKQDCDIVTKISEIKEGEGGFLSKEIGGNKLNNKAFTVMCSQFAIILRSGIPIGRTVQLIASKITDKKLKTLLNSVFEDVESGRSLAASFEANGGSFLPVTFIETIRAGEESGNLANSFESMYQHYDKQIKMKSKVKNALIYPIFVIIIAIAVVIVLMVKVVPTFTAIFDSYGAELPGITKALIAVSTFFQKAWWIILLIFVAYMVFRKIYSATEEGRLNLAKFQLKIPVLGNITELSAASEFGNTMTMLIEAGLPLTKCVDITSRVISNYYIGKNVGLITQKLEEGKSLGTALKDADVLPDILTDMTAVGEQTGELGATLKTVSGYYDAELDTAVTAAINKLEPITLVFIGGIAGFIVLAIYIAMFQMYNVM